MILQLVLTTLCTLSIMHAAAPATVTKAMVLEACKKRKEEAPVLHDAIGKIFLKELIAVIAAYYDHPWRLDDVVYMGYRPNKVKDDGSSRERYDLSGLGLDSLEGYHLLQLEESQPDVSQKLYEMDVTKNNLTEIPGGFFKISAHRFVLLGNRLNPQTTFDAFNSVYTEPHDDPDQFQGLYKFCVLGNQQLLEAPQQKIASPQ